MTTSNKTQMINNDLILLSSSLIFFICTAQVLIKAQNYVAKTARKRYVNKQIMGEKINDEQPKKYNDDINDKVSTQVNKKQHNDECDDKYEREQVLYDIVHNYCTPIFEKLTTKIMRDQICKFLDVSLFVYVYVFILLSIFFSNSYTLFAHCLNLISITQLLRSISYTITVLPRCDFRDKKYNPNKSAIQICIDCLLLKSELGYRNDLLPSGHILFIIVITLFTQEYTSVAFWFKCIIWVMNIIISSLMILMKKHYCICIFWAYVLGLCCFREYRDLCM